MIYDKKVFILEEHLEVNQVNSEFWIYVDWKHIKWRRHWE